VGDAVADLIKAASHGKSVDVKAAAVEALAIAAFVAVDELEETEEILACLRACWKQGEHCCTHPVPAAGAHVNM
jgi:hypothetical protein